MQDVTDGVLGAKITIKKGAWYTRPFGKTLNKRLIMVPVVRVGVGVNNAGAKPCCYDEADDQQFYEFYFTGVADRYTIFLIGG